VIVIGQFFQGKIFLPLVLSAIIELQLTSDTLMTKHCGKPIQWLIIDNFWLQGVRWGIIYVCISNIYVCISDHPSQQ
jgi:hypothetical protein